MQGVVKKWGNSAAVRLPSAVMRAAHIRLDQPVDVREEHGRIVIEPIGPAYDIDALIDGITEEKLPRGNGHGSTRRERELVRASEFVPAAGDIV